MFLKDQGDWRTLSLIGFCHLMIGLLLFGFFPIGEIWIIVLLTPLLTLYSSTQHEVMHGHPFQNQTLNDWLVIQPWGLLTPYHRFKDTHLAHHRDVNLCDPFDDPESWYQDPSDWEARSALSRSVFNFNNTLIGRMLIGPAIGITGFVKCDLHSICKGEVLIAGKWLLYFAFLTVLLYLVERYGAASIGGYFVAAYFGMSLLMVRTFLEHQAHEKVRGRSVIVENGGFLGWLFLNNSFHAVHHACPNLAWYRLPEFYRLKRAHFLEMNEGYSYASYREIFKQFSFKRKEPVPLPLDLNKHKKLKTSE